MPRIIPFPSVSGVRAIEWNPMTASSVSTSPYTGKSRIAIWPMQVFGAVITLPVMNVETAKAWFGFFLACNGRENYFEFGDSWFALERRPLGFCFAQATQGKSLNVRFTGLAASLALPSGSWVSIAGKLNRVTADCIADANGNAKLELWRSVQLEGETEVNYNSPKGLFRLDEDAPPLAWNASRMSPETTFSIIEYDA